MCIYLLYISYWEFSLKRVKVKEQTTGKTIKNYEKLEIKSDAVFQFIYINLKHSIICYTVAVEPLQKIFPTSNSNCEPYTRWFSRSFGSTSVEHLETITQKRRIEKSEKSGSPCRFLFSGVSSMLEPEQRFGFQANNEHCSNTNIIPLGRFAVEIKQNPWLFNVSRVSKTFIYSFLRFHVFCVEMLWSKNTFLSI